MAVLVNGGSASASEIFAARRTGHGTRRGRGAKTTFGKGIVQTLYSFPEGDGRTADHRRPTTPPPAAPSTARA